MKNLQGKAYSPWPIKLNELQDDLMKCANTDYEWSTHHLVRHILEEWLIARYKHPKDYYKKIRQQQTKAA